MNWFVAALALFALVHEAHCAASNIEWCYHDSTCNQTTWPSIAPLFCNGSRQSPINIVTASAANSSDLDEFIFTNFNNTSGLDKVKNTGKTVKVTLASGIQVSGGNLSEAYDSIQFHLHWGNGTSEGGSEHTINGKRYPMEMHIVNVKSSYNLNTTLAVADPEGLAALGFFIEEGTPSATAERAWSALIAYLDSITTANSEIAVTSQISLDDLLDGVDRSGYYRYLGSLTTPNCNEAVVWTVFKDNIKLNSTMIDRFSNTVRIGNSSSLLMTNVYRGIQPNLDVFQTVSSSSSTTCYSLGLMALSLILGRS